MLSKRIAVLIPPFILAAGIASGAVATGAADTETGSVKAAAANRAPVAAGKKVSTKEDVPKSIELSAKDKDGDPLTFTIVTWPLHGILTGSGTDWTYTPAVNYFGPDSFTFKANDGKVDSKAAKISITVTPVNDAPVAQHQEVTVDQDTPKAITLVATDVEKEKLTYKIVTKPLHGILTGKAPNVIYTPKSKYLGTDKFTFKANDGKLNSNIATVSIVVATPNHPPVAQDQSFTTAQTIPKSIMLVATDVDGDLLTYAIVTQPRHGALKGLPPTVTYIPAANYNGPDEFTFKANDGKANSNIAAVSITVTAAPVGNIITAAAAFPQDGATIKGSDIMVKGTVTNARGKETGVTVNGKVAMVFGPQFVANHIPLQEGRSNTIDVVATDTEGNTTATSVRVNGVAAEQYISLTANKDSGISPLEVTLTVDSSLELTRALLTYTGPGEVEYLSSTPGEYKLKLRAAGIYEFTVRIDSGGTVYQDSIGILVLSEAGLDAWLRAKWEAMRSRLAAGDIEGAVAGLSGFSKDHYRELFTALAPVLPEVVQEMSDIRFHEYRKDAAIYEIRTQRDGVDYSFQLLFTRDPDGIWGIASF